MTTGGAEEALLATLSKETGVVVSTSEADLENAAQDFGHEVRGQPLGVIRPCSIDELERVVAFANAHRLRCTPRGNGYSQSGQSVARGSLTLELTRLKRIERLDAGRETIECDAGVTWAELLAVTGAVGLIAPIVPLNLDITVGGILSVGGVGAASHRYGALVSHVRALEVITGEGKRLRCSREERPDLFDAALGGLGRCAVIARAELDLRRFLPRVRTHYLLYDDLDTWLADQVELVRAGGCDYLEAFCSACVQGLRNGPRGRAPFAEWFYGLHVSREYSDAASVERMTTDLRPYRRVHVEDDDTMAFTRRYEPRFAAMRRSGAWNARHPWVEAFVPLEAVRELLPQVLASVPLYLGDGHRLMFVRTERRPRFFALPQGEHAVAIAILPVAAPSPYEEDTTRALHAVHELLVSAGAKRYLSGWLEPMRREGAWQAHFGYDYDAWRRTKTTYDPQSTFSSQLFVSPPAL